MKLGAMSVLNSSNHNKGMVTHTTRSLTQTHYQVSQRTQPHWKNWRHSFALLWLLAAF